MKLLIKIIALLFTSVSIFTLFGCNNPQTPEINSETENTTSIVEEALDTQTERNLNVPITDYNTDFHLLIQPDSNQFDFYWVEKSSNDLLSEAIYQRQLDVLDHLGVNIVATKALGHAEYDQPFINSVKNKDGAIDTLQSHSYMAIARLILGGYLVDFKTVDEIDLDADYWGLDVMNEVAAKDKLYLGYSDYRLSNTIIIAFNKKLLDQYGDALDESIYDTVRGYRWTIDKMISLANLVYIDQTGDGKTDDDIFGITGKQWNSFTNFLTASNIPLVAETESGEYQVSVYNKTYQDRTSTLIEKIHNLSKSDCSYFRYREDPTKLINIISGQTLFSVDSNMNLPYYLSSDVEIGVLPLPMFDEAQKDIGYRSLDWGGWLCIPSYTDDQSMVGYTLEAIAFYSEDVQIAFYEKLLGKQVADAPEDSEMLEIIWDSICSDIGLTYSSITTALDTNLYMVANVTHANTNYSLASYVKSYETAANKQLKKFFASISD